MNEAKVISATLDPAPASWTVPGKNDGFADAGLITLLFLLFLIVFIYAVYDRYASGKGEGTPLRTTIPTLLTVGLAYDIIPPLADFSILLPLALIAGALARDIALWLRPERAGQ